MGPAARPSESPLRSASIKREANIDSSPQTSQACATSAKASPRVEVAERSSALKASKTLTFLVGPDRTVYPLGKVVVARLNGVTSCVRDLLKEVRDVRQIRRELQTAAFTRNELRVDMDAEAVRTAVLQLENHGQLQSATLEASHILKVLRRLMRSDIPWDEVSQIKRRVHRLIVLYEDTEGYGYSVPMQNSSATNPLNDAPSESPHVSTQTVVSLPGTQPATFDHLLNWLNTTNPLSVGTNADDRNKLADLDIVELAQLSLLAVKLRISSLVNNVAASLLALKIDTSTMEDLLYFIDSNPAPSSDLRQFLVTAVARCATSEAIKVAINKGWMTKEILSEITLALVHERDETLKKWAEDSLVAGEVVKGGKEAVTEKKSGPAANPKKRGAAQDADTPKGKKRKA